MLISKKRWLYVTEAAEDVTKIVQYSQLTDSLVAVDPTDVLVKRIETWDHWNESVISLHASHEMTVYHHARIWSLPIRWTGSCCLPTGHTVRRLLYETGAKLRDTASAICISLELESIPLTCLSVPLATYSLLGALFTSHPMHGMTPPSSVTVTAQLPATSRHFPHPSSVNGHSTSPLGRLSPLIEFDRR